MQNNFTMGTNVDQNLIAVNEISRLKFCKMVNKAGLKTKSRVSHFSSYNIISYFIHTDWINSLLDIKLVASESTLIRVDAYNSMWIKNINWIIAHYSS